ncbi:hypothetical protein TrVE_jg6374 [Triparma verrucosa]|uniref:Uncharacterized protein n=1 Tax=Triparma verrucosa TaxID=1606542 RepID=A0A9W7EP61_9STRA|nr:hypothetical protein TrVE_jg6374 [Triparma verrucosa]
MKGSLTAMTWEGGGRESGSSSSNVSASNVDSKRKVLKKLKADTALSANHADLEGMLSTVGVLAALVLSVHVATFFTISMQEMLIGDYRSCLNSYPEFRVFALDRLRKMDFPMLQDLSPDMDGNPDILNVTSSLLDPVCSVGGTDCYDDRTSIMNVDHVFHLTKEIFPMDQISPWMDRNIPFGTLSTHMYIYYNGTCITFFTLILLGSIFFYTTLALSDAREGEEVGNPLPTEYYNIVAMPVMLLFYVCMIIGLAMFFFNICFMLLIRAPSWQVVSWFPSMWMYSVMIPGLATIGCLAIAALILSNNYKFFENHKKRDKRKKSWTKSKLKTVM